MAAAASSVIAAAPLAATQAPAKHYDAPKSPATLAASKENPAAAKRMANPPNDPGAVEPSAAAVRMAALRLEQAVRAQVGTLSFRIDQAAGQVTVTVTDDETGQVLRRISPEEMLSSAQAISTMQGLLLSQSA